MPLKSFLIKVGMCNCNDEFFKSMCLKGVCLIYVIDIFFGRLNALLEMIEVTLLGFAENIEDVVINFVQNWQTFYKKDP